MIGLLNILFSAGREIGGVIWEDMKEKEFKEKFYNPKTGTYINHHGVEKDIHGNICLTHTDPFTGDKIQTDRNGNVVRNFSEEKRNKQMEDAKKDPAKTVIMWEQIEDFRNNPYSVVKGMRYKDLSTGRMYIIVDFELSHYAPNYYNKSYYERHYSIYCDLKTGKAVRFTDEYIQLNQKNNQCTTEQDMSKFINLINNTFTCVFDFYEWFYFNIDNKNKEHPLYHWGLHSNRKYIFGSSPYKK